MFKHIERFLFLTVAFSLLGLAASCYAASQAPTPDQEFMHLKNSALHLYYGSEIEDSRYLDEMKAAKKFLPDGLSFRPYLTDRGDPRVSIALFKNSCIRETSVQKSYSIAAEDLYHFLGVQKENYNVFLKSSKIEGDRKSVPHLLAVNYLVNQSRINTLMEAYSYKSPMFVFVGGPAIALAAIALRVSHPTFRFELLVCAKYDLPKYFLSFLECCGIPYRISDTFLSYSGSWAEFKKLYLGESH